jgi:hypothetical protein
MQRGNWVPIDKGLVSSLPSPGSREYSEVEAAFCVTVDYDNRKLVSQNGYATLWKWSRGRVKRFAEKRGWSISEDVPRGLNKLEIDRDKTGCVIHDPSWKKRTTDNTTGGQPTDNRRTTDDTTGGQPNVDNNNHLDCNADNRRTTDDTTDGQPTDNRRTTDDTLLYILDPNPDPNPKNNANAHKQKKTKKKSVDEKYMLFSKGFFSDLHKFHNGKEKATGKDIERAADTLDKLVRIDGYDFEKEVKPAIKWAIHDDFWGKQVRSIAALRARSKNNGLIKFENLFNSFSSSKVSTPTPVEEFERTNTDKKLAWEK